MQNDCLHLNPFNIQNHPNVWKKMKVDHVETLTNLILENLQFSNISNVKSDCLQVIREPSETCPTARPVLLWAELRFRLRAAEESIPEPRRARRPVAPHRWPPSCPWRTRSRREARGALLRPRLPAQRLRHPLTVHRRSRPGPPLVPRSIRPIRQVNRYLLLLIHVFDLFAKVNCTHLLFLSSWSRLGLKRGV